MEAFQLLSRGGARFDKNRFKNDVGLFNVRSTFYTLIIPLSALVQKSCKTDTGQKPTAELPPDLDFFKYAQGKRKTGDALGKGVEPESKKRKTNEEEPEPSDEAKGDNGGDAQPRTSAVPKHRVNVKGVNVPAPAETFQDLGVRYNLPSLILSNLAQNGFTHPTGIQSHGIPILLEVRSFFSFNSRYQRTVLFRLVIL